MEDRVTSSLLRDWEGTVLELLVNQPSSYWTPELGRGAYWSEPTLTFSGLVWGGVTGGTDVPTPKSSIEPGEPILLHQLTNQLPILLLQGQVSKG